VHHVGSFVWLLFLLLVCKFVATQPAEIAVSR